MSAILPFPLNLSAISLLDVILVSSNNKVLDSGVLHRPISDHSIVFTKLKVKKPKATTQSLSLHEVIRTIMQATLL